MVNGTAGSWGGQTKVAPVKKKIHHPKDATATSENLDIRPRLVHAHGITGGIRNNGELITIPDENGVGRDHVLCPVGQRLGLLRLDDQRMCFVEGTNARTFRSGAVREILAVTLSPNRKHICICEKVIEPVDPSIVVDGGHRGEGVAAHGTPQYFVSVHHNVPTSLKHRKLTMTYTPPATSSQPIAGGVRFGKVAFSADSKLLVAIADGEHDDEVRVRGHTPAAAGRTGTRDGSVAVGYFTMVVWDWQKDKMIASAHFQQNPKDRIDVSRVLFNPSDKNCITTSGHGCLKQWNLVSLGGEIVPRSLLPPNKCAENFVDHAWMFGKSVGTEPPDRRLIVVTEGSAASTVNERGVFSPVPASSPHGMVRRASTRGSIGDEQRSFQVFAFAPDVDNPLNYELVKTFAAPLPAISADRPPCTVETIAPYGKGFIVAGGGGFVQLWDRTEHSDLYAKSRTLIPHPVGHRNSRSSISPSKTTEVVSWGADAHFTCLNIHSNDELMVAVTKKQELMTFPLGSLEVMEDVDTLEAYNLFSEVAGAHERGTKVTCMSTCVCKPLLVTGGEDCTVRLWDYSNWHGGGDIVWPSTPGDGAPNDVSIHPSGNCLLIAYDSRVCLMTVLLDSLRPFREVTISKCRAVEYAHGGHVFACANGSLVSLRDSLSLNELAVYSAHVGPVNSIIWGDDDLSVFSGGTDGSMHGWDLPSGHRIDELGGLHSNAQVVGIAVAVPAAAFTSAVVGLKPRSTETRARATEITAAERAAERIAAAKAAATATAVALCWDGSLREISWRHPPAKVDRGGADRKTIGGQILKEDGPELHYSSPVVSAEDASNGIEACAAAALNNGRSFITSIIRCKTKPFLLAGAANGCIHVYTWPLKFPASSHHYDMADDVSLDESQASEHLVKQLSDADASDQLPPHLEIEGHSCSVETMSLSINDTLLFTGGSDGTVLVFKLEDVTDRAYALKLESEEVAKASHIHEPSYESLAPSTLAALQAEIDSELFNKEVTQASLEALEERQSEVEEALKKIQDLKHENAFTLHQQKGEWERKLMRASEAAKEQAIEAKTKYENLKKRQEKQKGEHDTYLDRLETVHSSTMVEIEASYEKKLRVEMERFDRLSEEIERVQQHCEELIGAQQDEHKRLLKAHDAEARRVEKELRSTVERLTEDEKHNAATFKEVLDQQEQEYEAELQALMLAAQTELSAERSSTSRMRVMVQERNATIDGLKKRGEELKSETHRQDLALADHKLRNSKLEATLEHFRRHMVERESTLSDKEKAIMDLRRTNTTLDNFRFVLDHRVQQLLEERAPISSQINDLEEHIDSMYDELEREYQSKQMANQVMDSKGMKINTLATELSTLQARLREKETFIDGIKRDLSALVSLNNPKEIENAVKDAYQKFVKDERPRKSNSVTSYKNAATTEKPARGSLLAEITESNGLGGKADTEMGAALKEAYHQRDCVEKMKNALARKLDATKREAAKSEIIRLEENTKLMTECNSLRTENLSLKRKVDHLRQVLRHCEVEDRKQTSNGGRPSRPSTAGAPSQGKARADPFSPLPSVSFSGFPGGGQGSITSDSLDSNQPQHAPSQHPDLLTVKRMGGIHMGPKKGTVTESGLRYERAAVMSENAKLADEVEENERIIQLQKLEMSALKGGQSFPRVARSGPTQRREVVSLKPRLPTDKSKGVRGLFPGDNAASSGPFSSKPAKLQER